MYIYMYMNIHIVYSYIYIYVCVYVCVYVYACAYKFYDFARCVLQYVNVVLLSCVFICKQAFRSILVVWLECRFLDTEVDGSIPGNSMLCP